MLGLQPEALELFRKEYMVLLNGADWGPFGAPPLVEGAVKAEGAAAATGVVETEGAGPVGIGAVIGAVLKQRK